MEVKLIVRAGTGLGKVQERYPDIEFDESDEKYEVYWCGRPLSDSEDPAEEFMTYDECVIFCGYCEGYFEKAECWIGENGSWAMSMIRRQDFSSLAMTLQDRQLHEATSKRYWAAREHGVIDADRVEKFSCIKALKLAMRKDRLVKVVDHWSDNVKGSIRKVTKTQGNGYWYTIGSDPKRLWADYAKRSQATFHDDGTITFQFPPGPVRFGVLK